MTPTRPQPPLLDDGFLVEPEPALRDPVVINGERYRIDSFQTGNHTGNHTGWARWAYIREYHKPHRIAVVMAAALVWDEAAGVWRLPDEQS